MGDVPVKTKMLSQRQATNQIVTTPENLDQSGLSKKCSADPDQNNPKGLIRQCLSVRLHLSGIFKRCKRHTAAA